MAISRRQFLGSTAAAVIVAGTMAKGRVFGANDRIRFCCIGLNGRGNDHIKSVCNLKDDAELVALCDVDSQVLDGHVAQLEKTLGKKPKAYKDMRDVMADKDIDAITIATPNHWHTLAAIWGCQAGKDVYVEKPLSHSVWEGRQLVAAAEKTGRIVMHGTQYRSEARLIRDIGLIHKGFIGPIVHSRGYVYKTGNRVAIGFGKPGKAPETLAWPLWQGPSPEHDYLVKENGGGLYVHYTWHWFWEYGNGEIGNQGVHEMDVAAWGHNRGLPVKVYSSGGRYAWKDQGETPNTQVTTFTYGDGSIMTFEVRNLGSFPEGGDDACSNSFFGSEGYYVRGKGFFDYKNKEIQVDEPMPVGKHPFDHFAAAIRSRKEDDLPAPVLPGHLSCAHCHLGNVAYRVGRSLEFDPKTERFKDDDANKLFKRAEYRKEFEVPQLA